MDFSPANPTVWIIFAGFIAAVWGVVRVFRAQNPGYPGRTPDDDH